MDQLIHGKTLEAWISRYPLLENILDGKEVFWPNPALLPSGEVLSQAPVTLEQILDAEARLARFAPFFMKAFPETISTGGILESPLQEVTAFQAADSPTGFSVPFGRLALKLDSQLPVSGSIKARGGIYEVLQYAEALAIKEGFLKPGDNYEIFAEDRLRQFFSSYRIAVGSTGNLGLSIGIISAVLGFQAQVHMSSDAKEWKKALLRSKGVEVIEYQSDYSVAVAQGRKLAEQDPLTYFVDDENSIHLFLGYAVAALRLSRQLKDLVLTPNQNQPLFVYLPCGVGGGPGGIAYGLKLVLGEHVHCYFAEPTHSPCMLLGMMTGLHDQVSVQEFGLDNRTIADGLAVGRPSRFVGGILTHLLDGIYTVTDEHMLMDLSRMAELEGIRLEPSALAGVRGPAWLESDPVIFERLKSIYSKEALNNAMHLAWATGGSMVPREVMERDIQEGRKLSSAI